MNKLILQEDIELENKYSLIYGFKNGDIVKTPNGIGTFNMYKENEKLGLMGIIYFKKFPQIVEDTNGRLASVINNSTVNGNIMYPILFIKNNDIPRT